MTDANNVHGIKVDRNIERRGAGFRLWFDENLYCRSPSLDYVFSWTSGQTFVNQPARTDQNYDQCCLQDSNCQSAIDTHDKSLFSETTYKPDQGVCFFVVQLVAKCGHVAAHVPTVHYRIKNAFVAYVVLPLRVCQIPRVTKLSFRCLRLSISTVTRDAILRVELRRGTCIVRRRSVDLKSRNHKQTDSHSEHNE